MDTKEKAMTGFVLVLATLGSAGLTTLLNQDNPTYECVSKGLVSDCINGVKATGTRCYYDPTNTAKYEYCKEKWVVKVKQLELISLEPISPSVSGARQYLCDQTKCVPIG